MAFHFKGKGEMETGRHTLARYQFEFSQESKSPLLNEPKYVEICFEGGMHKLIPRGDVKLVKIRNMYFGVGRRSLYAKYAMDRMLSILTLIKPSAVMEAYYTLNINSIPCAVSYFLL
jgi:hypothetical protein